MQDIGFLEWTWRDLSGAGRLRLVLQPALAVLLGIRVGLAEARVGKLPVVARLIRSSHERWKLLERSVMEAAVPLTLALVMDGVLQYLTLGRVRILSAVVVGLLLVWSPFTIARGATNRLWTRTHSRVGSHPH